MALPQTEKLQSGSASIDALAPPDALQFMLSSQIEALQTIRPELPQIERAARLVAETLRAGGQLVYAAAGSSGLMALADGCELHGTFGIPESQIQIHMAGGIPTDGHMPGDTEDDEDAAQRVVAGLSKADLVILLSASGTTPYVCEIARRAHAASIRIVAIANNPGTPLLEAADIAICPHTPPEALAGSTRLGAGTAQKVVLNMISTLSGVLLGHIHQGMMVNLQPDNKKLKDRAARIVSQLADVTTAMAEEALAASDGNTKLATLIALGVNRAEAAEILNAHGQHLGPSLKQIKNQTGRLS